MIERVNLRLTHPTLFGCVVVFALISIGLGLNFIFARPTFNQFMIDKEIIGTIFLCLGTVKLVAVTLIRNLKFIRFTMAMCAAFMMFWGIGTATTFFTGMTSLQLPVLYSGLIALQFLLLREPYVNPFTGRNGK